MISNLLLSGMRIIGILLKSDPTCKNADFILRKDKDFGTLSSLLFPKATMMILHQQALWTRTIDHVLLMVQLAKTTDLHDFDELFTLCIPVEFMIYEGARK